MSKLKVQLGSVFESGLRQVKIRSIQCIHVVKVVIKRNYHTIITIARITHALACVYLKGVTTHTT